MSVRLERRVISSAALGVVCVWAVSSQAGVKFLDGPTGIAASTISVTNDGLGLSRSNASVNPAYRWSESGAVALQSPTDHPTWKVSPTSMNRNGEIAGASLGFSAGLGQPVYWGGQASVAVELSRQGANGEYNTGSLDYAYLNTINDAGQIVGSMIRRNSATNALLGRVAVRWKDSQSDPVELQGLPLSTGTQLGMSYVYAQNESGTVVGYSQKYYSFTPEVPDTKARKALRWNADAVAPQVLDDLSPSTADRFTLAYDINEAGYAVGTSDLFVNGVRVAQPAVRWDPVTSAVTRLDLPASNPNQGFAKAVRINDSGVIFGTADKFNGSTYIGRVAARWSTGSTAITELDDLGPTGATFNSPEIFAVNESGVAGGICYLRLNNMDVRHAVLWRADSTQIIDLNQLLGDLSQQWILGYVSSISNTGWVGGNGSYDADGTGPIAKVDRAFLMLVPSAGTYGRGDANFDTHVNFDDLLILAQHYGESNPTQDVHVGDLDLNGSVDFDDLLALAQHYESGSASGAGIDASLLGSTFAADWALARAMVPEPASIVCGAMVGLVAGRNRK